MPDIRNIKDSSPNLALIRQLEKILVDAKSGQVVSGAWVLSWDDNSTSHGWAVDTRTYCKLMLGEITMSQHDFTVNIELLENGRCLAKAFDSND